jgi:hypothetical protein
VTLHSKMLHKTQSHCSPNLIFADVLNNSYTHTIFFSSRKLNYRILRNTRSEVKFEDLENIAVLQYVGVMGLWKGHFISFEMSITTYRLTLYVTIRKLPVKNNGKI